MTSLAFSYFFVIRTGDAALIRRLGLGMLGVAVAGVSGLLVWHSVFSRVDALMPAGLGR